ncbi:MAG: RNA-binding protein [Ignavibacteriae bacterium]|nr:MAG: RNA-binding protein [Ignavibacteriota bacterium]
MNIYVGNISRDASESEIRKEFEQYGEVTSINLIKDKFTNMLKGFGFVEMPKKNEAEEAIKNLDGTMVNGRPLTVNPAKPKTVSNNHNSGNSRRYNSRY